MTTDTTNPNQATESGCTICGRALGHRGHCDPCSRRIDRQRTKIEAAVRRRQAADYVAGMTERDVDCALYTRALDRVDGDLHVRCPDCEAVMPPATADDHDCPALFDVELGVDGVGATHWYHRRWDAVVVTRGTDLEGIQRLDGRPLREWYGFVQERRDWHAFGPRAGLSIDEDVRRKEVER